MLNDIRKNFTYEFDVKMARHLLELIITADSPRHLKRSAHMLQNSVERIVEFKLRRTQQHEIDIYFGKDISE